MRERPAGDALADLETGHFADGNRTVSRCLDLQIFLQLVDEGQRPALEANELRGGVENAIERAAPLNR